MVSAGRTGPDGTGLVGRDRELAAVLAHRRGTLVVTGEIGSGVSTLLERAAAATPETLSGRGEPAESELPFAGLHQVLRPVLDRAAGLPGRQRRALLTALAPDDTAPDDTAPDSTAPDSTAPDSGPARLLVGLAVLTLLSGPARRRPVRGVVDDVHLMDAGSREAFLFVARRLADEPVALLVGCRRADQFPGLPTLALPALDDAAAARLLDRQPRPPTGPVREQVLRTAAGNPLGLIELARATGTPGTAPPALGEPLPLTDRLERIFAAGLDGLPGPTRRALLLAAADTEDLVAARLAPELAGAERAGLIRFVGTTPRFRHPLVRSAVYQAAPLAERRWAHRELAGLLEHEPDRRAWHRAAAAAGPDAEVAAELAATAQRALRRGGFAAATAALERAATLSPAPRERATLLVRAATAALRTGSPSRVRRNAEQVPGLTDDAGLRAAAALRGGQALIATAHHDPALTMLASAATSADPVVATEARVSAAVAGYYAGDESSRLRVRALAAGDTWAVAVSDPHRDRPELVARLPGLVDAAGDDPERLTALGAMAWLLDETALAVGIYDRALHRARAEGRLNTGLRCSAGWAYLEHGRWAEADNASAAALTAVTGVLAAEGPDGVAEGLNHLGAASMTLRAAVLALSGGTAQARTLAEQALTLIDPMRSRAIGVRARWALGMADAADGDHERAYPLFRAQFDGDGDPVHYHASYPGLADLAEAAVRTGRESEASEIVERARKRLDRGGSARLHALVERALGLLDPDDAERHFTAALQDPDGFDRPFERAQTLLDQGEWLRRQRRISAARPVLAEALESFRRLGAVPWIERAGTELRASGVPSGPAARDALATLTPQQREIVGLAARGLSNREIGERMFLSPRTVGSHLYRSFPKLGVTTRAQLRDLR